MSDSDDHTVEGGLDAASEADDHDVTIAAVPLDTSPTDAAEPLASDTTRSPQDPEASKPEPALSDAEIGDPDHTASAVTAGPSTEPDPAPARLETPSPTPATPVDPAEAAAAFVAEARAASSQRTADVGADAKPSGSRRGLVIALAVVIAAQIIAGGTWLALRALDDEVAAPAPTPVPTLAPLAPTALPTAVTGPTAVPTATPIPPTPVWDLRPDGPSVAPFTWIVEAIVRDPQFYDGREGEPIDPSADLPNPISNPLPSGEPLILRVAAGQPDQAWAQVLLPGEQGTTAWARAEDFVWRSTNRMIEVDIATNLLTVFEGNSALLIVPVTSGRRDNPTPPTSSYVFSEPTFEGRRALFHLAAFDDVPLDHHGLPTMRIELTDERSNIGEYLTGGQILLTTDRVEDILRLIEPGARVEVVGTPPLPTPTPVPTPTPRPTPTRTPLRSSGTGCPPGAGGTAPSCYRVVERISLAGQCPGLQVVVQGNCMIFAGDPETLPDGGGSRCPATAPQQLEGRCYTNMGPIPIEDGPCPDEATEVNNECRVPLNQ